LLTSHCCIICLFFTLLDWCDVMQCDTNTISSLSSSLLSSSLSWFDSLTRRLGQQRVEAISIDISIDGLMELKWKIMWGETKPKTVHPAAWRCCTYYYYLIELLNTQSTDGEGWYPWIDGIKMKNNVRGNKTEDSTPDGMEVLYLLLLPNQIALYSINGPRRMVDGNCIK
jgi:hypothetical protein